MPDILQTLVPYLVGGMLILALVLFLAALVYFRRGKRDRYWRLRRAATLHGWQLFVVSLTLVFVASAVCLFSGFASYILEGSSPTPPATSASSPTPGLVTASTTVRPTIPPVATRTPEPAPSATRQPETAVPTAMPSTTPRPTLAPTRTGPASSPTPAGSTLTPTATEFPLLPLPSDVTPPAGAELSIVAVDGSVSADLQPVNPDTVLRAGATRIYFWVAYRGLVDGVAWERYLLRDGRAIQGGAYLWNGGAEGTSLYFFGDAEGFEPGEYEIRLSFSGVTVASQTVTVR